MFDFWKLVRLEKPSPYGHRPRGMMGGPKAVHSDDHRNVEDALVYPNVQFFDPNGLNFPDHTWGTPKADGLPGNGGYITCGLNMVEYDHQAKWDRHAGDQVGPIKEFFRNMNDPRIKHL